VTAKLLDGSAQAIAASVKVGAIKAREIVEQALSRIKTHNSALGTFTDVTATRALAKADAIDAARARGESLGPLAGAPFAVKNLFDIEGLKTRAGSKINRDRAPAKADATVVARLEAAGAVLIGALNMGEFAYDFTGENAHGGPSRNPHDLERMTGGSSGGSGAAVAGGLVPIALGSDTNGSIRVPSSFCGLFGLKPTYGRLSRSGAFPLSPASIMWGRSGAPRAISRSSMTPCSAATTGTRRKPTSRRRQHRQRSMTASPGFALQGSAAISRAQAKRAHLPPSTRSRAPCRRTMSSNSLAQIKRVRPPI
jgi:Asp-tRNA(Asn)/Glu-tRNA(Gln) amidotransferase A subunit family amidase